MGYVWCEIRQQSSEEPCDETSFGKKDAIDHFQVFLRSATILVFLFLIHS